MKRNLKKLLAMLLAALMLQSFATTFVLADENTQSDLTGDTYVLADFTADELSIEYEYDATVGPQGFLSSVNKSIVQTDFFGYGDDNSKALEWKLGNAEFYVNIDPVDWSEYDYVNVRLCAPVANQQFTYVLMGADSYGGASKVEKITTTGDWQVISIPVSDEKLSAAIANSTDGKSIGYMIFNCNGWGIQAGAYADLGKLDSSTGKTNKAIKDEYVYFDKIWLEKGENDYLEGIDKNGEDDEISIVKSFARRDVVDAEPTLSFSWENTREGGSEVFAMADIPKLTSVDYEFYNDTETKLNLDGYNYINFWLYSPRPQAGGFYIQVSEDETDEAPEVLEFIPYVDWIGWKLFSYPVSGDGDATTGDVGIIKVAVGGYDGGAYLYDTISNGDGTSSVVRTDKVLNSEKFNRWHENGAMGIECAYLSKNAPKMANQIIEPEIITSNTLLKTKTENGTNTVLFEAGKLNAAGSGFDGVTRITKNTAGRRMYNQTGAAPARSGVYMAEPESGSNKYTLIITDSAQDITKHINPDTTIYTASSAVDYCGKYLNLWMYNPGIKYDQMGNYSEYILRIIGKSSDNGIFPGATTTNSDIGIIANWEGWKLITIPLSETKLSSESFIYQIKLMSNYQTKPMVVGNNSTPSTSTNISETSRSFTAEELAKGYHTNGAYYNKWVDYRHYFMLDRMWISASAPVESFTYPTTYSSTVTDLNTRRFGGNASDYIGRIDGKPVVYKRNGNTVTDVSDDFPGIVSWDKVMRTYHIVDSSPNTDTTIKNFDYDATYVILWPQMYSVSGIKIDAGKAYYKFSTLANEIGNFTVDQSTDTASISLKGTIPENIRDNVIVAAVYDISDGVKELANVNIATYDAENGEISATVSANAGQTVSFMYLEDIESVKPVEKNVSYIKE